MRGAVAVAVLAVGPGLGGVTAAAATASRTFEVSVDGGAWSTGPVVLVPDEVRFAPGAVEEVGFRVRVVPSRAVELTVALQGGAADALWAGLDGSLAAGTGSVAVKPPGRADALGPVRLRLAAGAEAALSLRLDLPATADDGVQRLETLVTLVLRAEEVAGGGVDAGTGGRPGGRVPALAATGSAGASGALVLVAIAGSLTVVAGVVVVVSRAIPRHGARLTILGTCRPADCGRALDPGGARGDRRTRRRVGV
jgi:hypothetical protein